MSVIFNYCAIEQENWYSLFKRSKGPNSVQSRGANLRKTPIFELRIDKVFTFQFFMSKYYEATTS